MAQNASNNHHTIRIYTKFSSSVINKNMSQYLKTVPINHILALIEKYIYNEALLILFHFAFQMFDERTGKAMRAPMTFWSKYGEKIHRKKSERMYDVVSTAD